MASHNLEIICPCCESKLRIDAKTGEVIWKDEKKKELSSLSDMVKGLDAHNVGAEEFGHSLDMPSQDLGAGNFGLVGIDCAATSP